MASGDILAIFTPLHTSSKTTATHDTRNDHPVLDFDSGGGEKAYFGDALEGYDGGGLTIDIWFSMSTATSGNIQAAVAIERIGSETLDIDSDSFAAENEVDDQSVPSTSGYLKKVTITFTDGADMDSLADDEPYRMSVELGNATTSNASGDREFHYAVVKET